MPTGSLRLSGRGGNGLYQVHVYADDVTLLGEIKNTIENNA
jgi:hypothetical protein